MQKDPRRRFEFHQAVISRLDHYHVECFSSTIHMLSIVTSYEETAHVEFINMVDLASRSLKSPILFWDSHYCLLLDRTRIFRYLCHEGCVQEILEGREKNMVYNDRLEYTR